MDVELRSNKQMTGTKVFIHMLGDFCQGRLARSCKAESVACSSQAGPVLLWTMLESLSCTSWRTTGIAW